MRQYNVISALWRAPLFSKSFYMDVATNWRGIGLWYLVLLIALSWGIVLTRATLAVTGYIETGAPVDLKDIPPITITRGVASSPVPQPYTIFSDSGRKVCVLDTTGATTMPADAGAVVLITKTEVIQDDRGRIERHALTGVPDGLYDQAWIISWIRWFRNMLLPLGLPIVTAIWLAGHLLLALIFTLIGLGFNSIFHGKLSFAALFRISATAATTAIILDTILSLLNYASQPGLIWFLLRAITLAYVIFGVRAGAEATRPLQAFPVQFPEMQALPVEPLSPPHETAPDPVPPEDDSSSQFP